MCGIFGYIGSRDNAVKIVFEGLKRLEYRGYDSWGIATISQTPKSKLQNPKIIVDKHSKDAPFIAYAPELDIASCGPTEEKARENLHEAVKITMQEIERKGKLTEFLKEMGFQKEKTHWVPPRVSFEPFFFPRLT